MENEEYTKTLERIEQMFKTKDKELWKLAQRICHEKRINYWVQVDSIRYYTLGPGKPFKRVHRYSVIEPEIVKHFGVGQFTYSSFVDTYKIVLDDSTKRKNRGILPK